MSIETEEKLSSEAKYQGGGRQIVALHLGDEVYGIDIATIHTVIVLQDITSVPKTPKYVRGVMNLRGQIVPVIDLRMRLDMPVLSADEQKNARVVIVHTEGLHAGLIVDAVSEVLTLAEGSVGPPSGLIASNDCEFITGIGKVPKVDGRNGTKDQLILLLDVIKVLTTTPQELENLKQIQKAA